METDNLGSKEEVQSSVSNEVSSLDREKQLDLIDVVNNLQNKLMASGQRLDISLPQIVVVGCQSAGKSSVLESFVDKEFLPRGKNVVTRRPTLVQLHPSSEEEYGVFLHRPGERFTNFCLIREEIVNETNRHPGPVGFSSDPITLKIFSPKVLKLTLVDLPGLIKNVVEGQDESSIAEVWNMVLSYIQNPNSIILAVTPANQDIANSDALNIAKEVDPKRERTIGVLTKLDLMDDGTDAREILENKKLPLKKGYVGVLNRSQMDIDQKRNIKFIRKKEKHFFHMRSCYRHLSDRMGTPYLQQLLQKTLKEHIKNCLPAVRKELAQKLAECQRQLTEFEKIYGHGSKAKHFYVIKIIQQFIEEITVKIMGHSELVQMKVLSVGALIHHALFTEVQKTLDLELNPDKEDLVILIANLYGIRNAIAVPSLAVDAACRELLKRYKEPLNVSVTCVTDLLRKAIIRTASTTMDLYPGLKNEVICMVQDSIDRESENTIERLSAHIDAEMFFVNLNHPDFDTTILDPVAPMAEPAKIWNEKNKKDLPKSDQIVMKFHSSSMFRVKAQYVTRLVTKYLEIVKKQIGDIAIKYITYFLVNKVMSFIKADLIPSLLESDSFGNLVEEFAQDFKRKEAIEATISCIKEAMDAIRNF